MLKESKITHLLNKTDLIDQLDSILGAYAEKAYSLLEKPFCLFDGKTLLATDNLADIAGGASETAELFQTLADNSNIEMDIALELRERAQSLRAIADNPSLFIE